LVILLAAEGVTESARGLEGKVQRGSFRCSFFLELLHAVRADVPSTLCVRAKKESWDDVARRLFLELLSEHRLTFIELSNRLHPLGVEAEPDATERQVINGSYPFTLLLQLSALAPIPLLQRFVDQTDIVAIATHAS